jgi:formylmethanofuran dehydrogenase subunit B
VKSRCARSANWRRGSSKRNWEQYQPVAGQLDPLEQPLEHQHNHPHEQPLEYPHDRSHDRPHEHPNEQALIATLEQAAQILCSAAAPLVYGLTQLTCEAQAMAVRIAETLRGYLDIPAGCVPLARGRPLVTVGETRTTLGEVRARADLILFIGCRPWETQPRFLERWGLAQHIQSAFAAISQAAAPVSDHASQSSARLVPTVALLELHADSYPQAAAERLESTALFAHSRKLQHRLNQVQLELLLDELALVAAGSAAALEKAHTRCGSVPGNLNRAAWNELLTAWREARYPVLVYDPSELLFPSSATLSGELCERIELAGLAKARKGQAAVWPLAPPGNIAGAEYVLTARTGASHALGFTRGFAESHPLEYHAQTLLEDSAVDAAIFLNEPPAAGWSGRAWQHLRNIPVVFIGDHETRLNTNLTQLVIETKSFPWAEAGTIIRGDGVPLPLDPVRGSAAPAMQTVLVRLLAAIERVKNTPSACRQSVVSAKSDSQH